MAQNALYIYKVVFKKKTKTPKHSIWIFMECTLASPLLHIANFLSVFQGFLPFSRNPRFQLKRGSDAKKVENPWNSTLVTSPSQLFLDQFKELFHTWELQDHVKSRSPLVDYTWDQGRSWKGKHKALTSVLSLLVFSSRFRSSSSCSSSLMLSSRTLGQKSPSK